MTRMVFANLRIALCGEFGSNWPKDKMGRFIKNNGGERVDIGDRGVTHLITTTEAFDSELSQVKKAQKLGIPLVTFDWFEDSLQTRSKKRESAYDVAKAAKERRLKKEKQRRKREAHIASGINTFVHNVREASQLTRLSGYNVYTDPTGFQYDITLVRTTLSNNTNERVVLRLLESHEPPFWYACYSTYWSPIGSYAQEECAPMASSFEVAFEAFKKEYKYRAKKDWDQRCNGKVPTLEDGVTRNPAAFVHIGSESGSLGMDIPPGRYRSPTPEPVQALYNDGPDNDDILWTKCGQHPRKNTEIIEISSSDENDEGGQDDSASSATLYDENERGWGIVKGNWGTVPQSAIVAEKDSDEQYAAMLAADRSSANTMTNNVNDEAYTAQFDSEPEPIVYYKEEGVEMRPGIVQGFWGGAVRPQPHVLD